MADEAGRLRRIAEAHKNHVVNGMTSKYCVECNWRWPCPTYVWATDERCDPVIDSWLPVDYPDADATC